MADVKTSKISQNICGLCDENPSKYCCPRCEVFYCSLDCYKSEKHLQCSESFYRDCVNSELMAHNADDESRDKMVDILKRMQDDDNIDINDLIEYDDDDEPADSDDEEEDDLEKRIENINLDDADEIWNALTEDEKNEFEALINQGDVGSIMPQWEAWWMYRRDKKLVEDVDVKVDDEEALKNCPALKAVPKFESLTAVKPSPAIKSNITNVLASYAFIMRYFNGEIEPGEATICLFNICDNLNSNTNFDDPAVALESVAQKCLQSELIQTDEASIAVMKKDTFLLIRGPSDDNEKYYCQAALSDLHHILNRAKTLDKQKDQKTPKDKTVFSKKFPEHEKEHLPSLDVSKVKKCIKKVEYYLSYVDSYDMDFD
ncbi:zinc finger HIT domain-containing protein 2 [Spodoptera litura]|uniref:Zinc finger HIT domain-containing protein 2 n=1 Tax=Spodoptera litura TaxID=69820 RepID=A0A9J7ENB0_SPOLT|nr:zinc finger HIT domain-containing protein 2 [Spodoptera litura]